MTATRRVAGRAQQAAHGAWRRSVRLIFVCGVNPGPFVNRSGRSGEQQTTPVSRRAGATRWRLRPLVAIMRVFYCGFLAGRSLAASGGSRRKQRSRQGSMRDDNAGHGRAKPRDLRRCSRGAPEPGWQSRRVGVAGENERPAAQAAGAKGLAERTEATPTWRVCFGRGPNSADTWRVGSGFGACACPRPSASVGSVRPGCNPQSCRASGVSKICPRSG